MKIIRYNPHRRRWEWSGVLTGTWWPLAGQTHERFLRELGWTYDIYKE